MHKYKKILIVKKKKKQVMNFLDLNTIWHPIPELSAGLGTLCIIR